jgi:hypothetical protein
MESTENSLSETKLLYSRGGRGNMGSMALGWGEGVGGQSEKSCIHIHESVSIFQDIISSVTSSNTVLWWSFLTLRMPPYMVAFHNVTKSHHTWWHSVLHENVKRSTEHGGTFLTSKVHHSSWHSITLKSATMNGWMSCLINVTVTARSTLKLRLK